MAEENKPKEKGVGKRLITVNSKKLIKLVAESSTYHQYEVEDILTHLAIVLQQQVSAGEIVSIEHLGKFYAKEKKTAEWYSPTGENYVPSVVTAIPYFVPCKEYRRYVIANFPYTIEGEKHRYVAQSKEQQSDEDNDEDETVDD